MGGNENAMREALGEFLGILEYKVRHGSMTAADVRVIMDAIQAGGGVRATVSDLAGYYQTSEVNIRSVIKRRFTLNGNTRALTFFGGDPVTAADLAGTGYIDVLYDWYSGALQLMSPLAPATA